jgi:hypothetical protein
MSISPVIKVTQLEHVCMVVRNLEKSIESLQNSFGIGPWNDVRVRDASYMRNMTYKGKPAEFSFKCAMTNGKIGGFEVELIQPISDNTIYSDFLKERGEGIHHVGYYICGSMQELAETKQKLENAGFPCIMSAEGPRGAFAYFDTNDILHTVLEAFYKKAVAE